MKLSFSIPKSRPSAAVAGGGAAAATAFSSGADPDLPRPEFVTVFDPSNPPTQSSIAPIPPIPNADLLRPYKKMKNLIPDNLDPTAPSTHFVMDTSNPDDSSVTYGLTLRKPGLTADIGTSVSVNSNDLAVRSFRDDLSELADDRGFAEFDRVPVEGFGAAVLAGYGWKEGMAIGRRGDKEDPKVVMYERRQMVNAGLGYVPSVGDPKVSRRKEKRVAVEERKADSRVKELEVKPDEKSSNGGSNTSKDKWLVRDIKVRVVSKEFRRGKLYRQKGKVVEVVGATTCVVKMDESGEVVEGVEQDVLETALPKRGGMVLVLYGRHNGVLGILVEKDMDKETGVVEDGVRRSRVKVHLDQIAEFVGEPPRRQS